MNSQSHHLKEEWIKGSFKNRPKRGRDNLGRFI